MARAHAHIGPVALETRIEVGHHQLVADEPAARGGADAGPAPYALLLASLGSCTAITLRMYADRKAWPLASVEVRLFLHGQGDTLRIERVLVLAGVDAGQAARLAEIAERTPVTLTLKGGVPIDTRIGE
jgi:putative redox protein